jgi:hypothetical protein
LAGNTVDISTIITPDNMGMYVANKFQEWDVLRQTWRSNSAETRKYLFARDTTQTSNVDLPWKNKTTTPKLTQIRDNLIANYEASLFPKRKWLFWEGGDEDSASKDKRDSIEAYITYVIGQPDFKKNIRKILTDYVDDGNCIVMPEWVDNRHEVKIGRTDTVLKLGYVGPTVRRVAPLDIVFNPIASSFTESPKIIRKVATMGEVKEMLEALTTEETKDTIQNLWNYMKEIRNVSASTPSGSFTEKDTYLKMDGFSSYQAYLGSGYVELLYFYGDFYDIQNDIFYKNHKIIVADRHKVISKEPNPSYFGTAPIYHAGWRVRQDNLWAMGPLENLIGMQYRIDHLENMKADVLDLVGYPLLKIKGYVEDFEWQPMERIICGDDGDVEMIAPPYQVLQLDNEIKNYMETMEAMAGSPKESMGFRNPGEKTMYEVQRIENAYNRIFQNKIAQFEEFVLEPLLNAMLEMARRNMEETQVSIFNDQLTLNTFKSLTPEDITGVGRLYPLAARHFAEQAEVLQNLNTFVNSAMYQDPTVRVHFSGVKMAQMIEEFFQIEDYKVVQPYVQVSEIADMQRLQQAATEQVQMEAQTPSGVAPDDASHGVSAGPQPGGGLKMPMVSKPNHTPTSPYSVAQ